MELRPLRPDLPFGAVVSGVDLSAPLGGAEWERIEAAFLEQGLLVFRGQWALGTEGLVDFAQHWRTEPARR